MKRLRSDLWRRVSSGASFRRDPLAFLRALPEEGGAIRFRAGHQAFTLVRDPSLIERVLISERHRFGEGKWTLRGRFLLHDCLITREGQAHGARRALLDTCFSRTAVAHCDEVILARTQRLLARWQPGQIFDLAHELGCLALAIFCECMLGIDSDDAQEAEQLTKDARVMLAALSRLPRPLSAANAARRRLDHFARRVKTGPLLDALTESGLSDQDIRNEIVALLTASIDTTPITMSRILIMLEGHPAVGALLREELGRVLADRHPRNGDIGALGELSRIVHETLRLFPPVRFIDRRALEPVELGGLRIAAGSFLLISPLYTHRDERFFEQPDLFIPVRFSTDQLANRTRFTYFPFGAGDHACIGSGLARLEITLIVAMLARRWSFRPLNWGASTENAGRGFSIQLMAVA